MELSYGLVNLMYFMLCDELNRIKGSRSNKRRKLLTCFTNSLFKVYNNLSLRETGPEVYNMTSLTILLTESFNKDLLTCMLSIKVLVLCVILVGLVMTGSTPSSKTFSNNSSVDWCCSSFK